MINRASRLIWDLPVRLAHGLLVMAVLGSYLTAQRGRVLFNGHKYCGYTILVLVSFRIVWGFAGTRHARFSQFMRSPRRAWQYFVLLCGKNAASSYVGHNPMGGWSVVAMLAVLMAQAVSGLFATDDVSRVGPLFGWVSIALSHTMGSYHHVLFTLLAVLILGHVLTIAYYGFVRRENLLTPMLTGRKPAAIASEFDEIHDSRVLMALVIAGVLAAVLAAALALAPQASLSIF